MSWWEALKDRLGSVWDRLWKAIWAFQSIPPRWFELVAIVFVIAVAAIGAIAYFGIPLDQRTQANVLPLLQTTFGGLAVGSLILVWAQLRHTATNSKIVAYHQYFHDLPSGDKTSKLYKALDRLTIQLPEWYEPLSPEDAQRIVADQPQDLDHASWAVREYLNDFEEFCAAVNCRLVDVDYAYHIEEPRVLRAYYGFEEVIKLWTKEENAKYLGLVKKIAAKNGWGIEIDADLNLKPSTFYLELKKLAEEWNERKSKEMWKEAKKADVDRRRLQKRAESERRKKARAERANPRGVRGSF